MTRRRTIGEHISLRRRSFAINGRYSRFVGLMKLVLPMSAAGLAALVVAWPYLIGREQGFPLTYADIGNGAAEADYMINGRFFGSDEKNRPIRVTAETVTHVDGDPDTVQFTSPKADIMLGNGTRLGLIADRGTLHRAGQTLVLEGGVDVVSDQGYEFRTERVEVDLRARAARSDTPVEGKSPFGVLHAEGFRFIHEGRTMHFTGQVRMVLHPRKGV